MKNFLCICTLLLASSLYAAPTQSAGLKANLALKEWPTFVESLVYYQRFYPGVFVPLELTRLDALPQNELQVLIVKHGQAWAESGKKAAYSLRDDKLIVLSRTANQDIQQLVARYRKSHPKKNLNGSHRWVTEAMSARSRTALSLLDPVFAASVLGEKIKKVVETKPEIQPIAYSIKEDKIVFEGLPPAWAQRNLDPKPYLEMQITRVGGEDGRELKVRSFFRGDANPIGEDLRARREYFRGSYINDKDPGPFPFGRYPDNAEVFINEGGGHFSGDGHNHAH